MSNKRNPLYTKSPAKLPPDLLPRRIRSYARTGVLPPGIVRSGEEKFTPVDPNAALIDRIVENTDILVATQIIERGITGRKITVTDTPIRIIDGKFQRGYIVLNPASVSGALTAGGTTLASALRAALATGNTQATPIGVANYRNVRLFLDISASTGGLVTINSQSQDPASLNWIDTQTDIFSTPAAVGTYYADLGTLGVDNAFAISFAVDVTGSSTFSVGHILKDGLPGTSSGIEKTIFLGGRDVKEDTGLPLLEGQKERLWTRPNTELYAISKVSGGVELAVFELQ